MSLFAWLVLGLLAGFIASHLVNHRGEGMVLDILLGIVGAIIGGWLAGLLHISVNVGPSILNQIIIAFAGAVILLLIWRLVFRRGK